MPNPIYFEDLKRWYELQKYPVKPDTLKQYLEENELEFAFCSSTCYVRTADKFCQLYIIQHNIFEFREEDIDYDNVPYVEEPTAIDEKSLETLITLIEQIVNDLDKQSKSYYPVYNMAMNHWIQYKRESRVDET